MSLIIKPISAQLITDADMLGKAVTQFLKLGPLRDLPNRPREKEKCYLFFRRQEPYMGRYICFWD